MLIKATTLTASLTLALLAATLAPASAELTKSAKLRRTKSAPATPICFIQLPNQAIVNLQSLCGATKAPSATINLSSEDKNTDPALLETEPGAQSAKPETIDPSRNLIEPPLVSEEPTNRPDEDIIAENSTSKPQPSNPASQSE